MIPDDMAQRVIRGELPLQNVVIRGGDFFVNPRAEFRIPLTHSLQTTVFLDAGNVWTRAPSWLTLFSDNSATMAGGSINYWHLRYAIGTGLRLNTPVGPLVFDYGFNIERVLDRLFPNRANQRFWEDLGAFHFSIGLF
jgi:outer membrane protein assembly factor BamA